VILSLQQMQALARGVGFPDPVLAAAIAMAESNGDSCAQGDPNIGWHPCDRANGASHSFGLWQVNTPAHPEYNATSLLDPNYNARAAYAISSSGTNWRPWSTAWEDANLRIGYLGAGAPFWRWNIPMPPLPPTPPRPPPKPTPVVRPSRSVPGPVVTLTAVVLAATAGYAASQRSRFR